MLKEWLRTSQVVAMDITWRRRRLIIARDPDVA
jgi:hypothetical protein